MRKLRLDVFAPGPDRGPVAARTPRPGLRRRIGLLAARLGGAALGTAWAGAFAWAQEGDPWAAPAPAPAGFGVGGLALAMLAAVGLGALVAAGLRWMKSRGLAWKASSNRCMRHRETFPLGGGRFLALMDMGAESWVLAVTKTDVRLLGQIRIDPPEDRPADPGPDRLPLRAGAPILGKEAGG
jgi:hypothetical protein